MNASKTKTAKNAKTAEKPLDPFAVDFFGANKSASGDEKKPSAAKDVKASVSGGPEAVKSVKWFEAIPHLTRAEYVFSEQIEKLPDNLTKAAAHKISEIVTRYTFQAPKTVRCQMISITEVDLRQALGQLEKSPQTFLALGTRPGGATALVAFDTGFASSVIDLVLTGKAERQTVPRGLSPIENAIVEFIAGNILASINDFVGQPLFSLQTVEGPFENVFEKAERGAESVFRLDFADFSGIITVLASKDFVAETDRTQNPLFAQKNGRGTFEFFEKIAPLVRMRVPVGTTALEAESLAYLEPGDIVLIENALVDFRGASFSGKGKIYLGSGDNVTLSGQFVQPDALDGKGGALGLKFEEMRSSAVRRRQNFDKFDMENKETEKAEIPLEETAGEENAGAENDGAGDAPADPAETGAAAALENVLVNLKVEIAGDKISLREIQNLRAGQIINLGCRPTDPVRIVTDAGDQPVALGELVDVEGQLGVRLTRVFI